MTKENFNKAMQIDLQINILQNDIRRVKEEFHCTFHPVTKELILNKLCSKLYDLQQEFNEL